MNFDWAIWAANFPVSWRYEEAIPKVGLPERITISRAGEELPLTLDEFIEIARRLQAETPHGLES